MKPLIEIKSIPMSIELKINKATYELASGNASVEIMHDKGKLQMRMQPAKLKVDTFEANNSTPFRIVGKPSVENVKKGILAEYNTTANYARGGNMLLDINVNDNILSDIAYQRFNRDVMSKQFNLGLTPIEPVENEPVETEFNPKELSIRYEMDKLNFDWKLNRPEMKFIPGDIELIIKEYARVELEYVGSPIYVPPSAEPNHGYSQINTKA